MRFTSFTGGVTALFATGLAQAQYQLTNHYDINNFFDNFDFFTGSDPTHGLVDYADRNTAFSNNLAGSQDGAIYMGVDRTGPLTERGRRSVRLESKDTFTKGLFVADIAHMPSSTCGAWPAFWMFGDGSPGWPQQGEIDIIEGVNNQVSNINTLHTGPGCSVSTDGGLEDTHTEGTNCNASNGNLGCGQKTASNQNYGDGFNDIGGGVYATEWTSDHISVWFFPRYAIPEDLHSDNPNPASWGPPQARFNGGSGCNIDEHFYGHKLIFNITFCGDWAGSPDVWNSNPECSAVAPTCNEFVASNPGAFTEAFWRVNGIKVYNAN